MTSRYETPELLAVGVVHQVVLGQKSGTPVELTDMPHHGLSDW
jgi:hypothetical protein